MSMVSTFVPGVHKYPGTTAITLRGVVSPVRSVQLTNEIVFFTVHNSWPLQLPPASAPAQIHDVSRSQLTTRWEKNSPSPTLTNYAWMKYPRFGTATNLVCNTGIHKMVIGKTRSFMPTAKVRNIILSRFSRGTEIQSSLTGSCYPFLNFQICFLKTQDFFRISLASCLNVLS